MTEDGIRNFRDTTKDDGTGNKVCIWCYRAAADCVIAEDPCNGRKRYEAGPKPPRGGILFTDGRTLYAG